MSAIPIRLRLTLAFAVAMAVVLAAMGAFVYVRVGKTLQTSTDQSLRSQAVETERRVAAGGAALDPDVGGRVLVQLVDRQGRVVRSSPPGARRLLDARQLTDVRAGGRLLTSVDGQWRVLAEPLRVRRRQLVLVLARSLDPREEALDRLLREFLVAGPAALLAAAAAGYGLAAAALRPVEAMRRRAEAISAETPGRRLPVPAARDEVSRLASTLNEMLERLEAALARERRFTAEASHELRTPLALLRTELEVALRRRRSREELEAALRSAAVETERLTRLAADLLLIARADQGRLPIRSVPIAADAVLGAVAERFAVRAAELGRPVRVRPAPGVVLDADALRLEQALGNVAHNALAYGAGPVELSVRVRDGLAELHVVDEGPGFPPGFLERAFDRFSRADEARSGGGTGLGLSIVDLIARAHRGSAGAANRPAGGADVWIAIPLARQAEAAAPPEPQLA